MTRSVSSKAWTDQCWRAPLRVTKAWATIQAPARATAGGHAALRDTPGQTADGGFITKPGEP